MSTAHSVESDNFHHYSSARNLRCAECGRSDLTTVTYIDGRSFCSVCVGRLFPVVTTATADSQQIAPKPTSSAHRTTPCASVDALVESYRNAISFKGLEEAFAVVVQLADLARQQQEQLASHSTCLHDDATLCRHIGPLLTRNKEQQADLAAANAELERIRVALGGYADSDLASLATTLAAGCANSARLYDALDSIIAQVAAVPWQSTAIEANVGRDDNRWDIHLWHDGVSVDIFLPPLHERRYPMTHDEDVRLRGEG